MLIISYIYFNKMQYYSFSVAFPICGVLNQRCLEKNRNISGLIP